MSEEEINLRTIFRIKLKIPLQSQRSNDYPNSGIFRKKIIIIINFHIFVLSINIFIYVCRISIYFRRIFSMNVRLLNSILALILIYILKWLRSLDIVLIYIFSSYVSKNVIVSFLLSYRVKLKHHTFLAIDLKK